MNPKPTPGQIHVQLPEKNKLVLRCLADIGLIEQGDGLTFTPADRFNLTQARMDQRPELN